MRQRYSGSSISQEVRSAQRSFHSRRLSRNSFILQRFHARASDICVRQSMRLIRISSMHSMTSLSSMRKSLTESSMRSLHTSMRFQAMRSARRQPTRSRLCIRSLARWSLSAILARQSEESSRERMFTERYSTRASLTVSIR